MDIKVIGCDGVDWIHLNPVVSSCEYVNKPSKGGKFLHQQLLK